MRRLGKVGMRVEDLLRENARRFGARTALVASKRRLSYAELDRMSDHLSDALKAAGVARGDSVVVVMENCWEAVVALFAALKAGAVFCPADPESPAEGLSTFVAKNQPSAVVTQTRLASAVGAAVAGAQSVRLVVLARGEAAPAGSGCVRFEDIVSRTRHPAESRDEVADTEPAMRIDVAGPSGSSHDVVLAHRDLTGAAATVIRHLEDREDETVLVALPPGTEEWIRALLATVALGAALVLERPFRFAHALFSRLGEERVTCLAVAPRLAATLLEAEDIRSERFPDLRSMLDVSASGLSAGQVSGLGAALPSTRLTRVDVAPKLEAKAATAEVVRHEPPALRSAAFGAALAAAKRLSAGGESEGADPALPPIGGSCAAF